MDYSIYSTIAFLDANVVLEGKALSELPWDEIDSAGRILVLFVPQVLKEIDSKKRDGRLQKYARGFNRLIASAAETGEPIRLIDGSLVVDISLAETRIINWDELDDLDMDEPDARVIAQVLNEKHTFFEDRIFVSQDINPIGIATRHGLKVKRLSENWLRPPEPSPDQRKIAKLETQVRELKATEPELLASVKFLTELPFAHCVVSELSAYERSQLQRNILSANPRVSQSGGFAFNGAFDYDTDYNEKFESWRDGAVPRFVNELCGDINRMYAQLPMVFELKNDGFIQAESLILNVKVVNGTISSRWNIVPPFPSAPRPDTRGWISKVTDNQLLVDDFREEIGKHDMNFDLEADGGDEFEVHCQDFRHGRKWKFESILTASPHTSDDVVVIVSITAANMRGENRYVFKLQHETREIELSSIYDLKSMRFVADRPMDGVLRSALDAEDFSMFNVFTYMEGI